jgi:hypothetical protein
MSYDQVFPTDFAKSAFIVARVLRGEKPADLPVMIASKFELGINTVCQDPWPSGSCEFARPRRRGDRITRDVRLWHLADMAATSRMSAFGLFKLKPDVALKPLLAPFGPGLPPSSQLTCSNQADSAIMYL